MEAKPIESKETPTHPEFHSPQPAAGGWPVAFGINSPSLATSISGCSHASAPPHQLHRQVSGFGGTVQKGSRKEIDQPAAMGEVGGSPRTSAAHPSEARPEKAGVSAEPHVSCNMISPRPTHKQITVHFNADLSSNLGGAQLRTSKPTIQKIQVYPGDTASTPYIAHNRTNQPITGVSTYHVTPPKVGIYSNKIQCFRFEEQRLKPHETIEMPTPSLTDPDFFKDPKMRDVDTTTLPYTSYLR
jgi:cytochrome c oxidase assembly protein subunit 11